MSIYFLDMSDKFTPKLIMKKKNKGRFKAKMTIISAKNSKIKLMINELNISDEASFEYIMNKTSFEYQYFLLFFF